MYNNTLYIDNKEQEININSKLSNTNNNISKNENISLKEYIEKRSLDFGDKTLTHQWWGGDGSGTNTNFIIKDEEYDEFLNIYAKELKKTKKILHVMEQPKEFGPLCLDYDIKQTSPERTLNIDNIEYVISIINSIVAKNYMIKNRKNLDSYVFMKNEPFYIKDKKIYSDGFHLIYPNLILNSTDRFLIYHESRKEIIRQELFSNIYPTLVYVKNLKNNINLEDSDKNLEDSDKNLEDSEELLNNNYYLLDEKGKEKINDEIFDSCVILKNKWFMYGSGKNINGENNIYILKYIFDYNVNEIEEKPRTKELVKILSIRKPSNENNIILPKNNKEYLNIIEIIKNKYIKKQKVIENKTEFINNNKLIKITNIDEVEYAKKLIKLLSPIRSHLYTDWIIVAWALYNISPTLLPEFIEFSKLDKKKFNENKCIEVWEACTYRNNNNGYSLPSLSKWAKEDNIEEYNKLNRKKINNKLMNGNINTDFDIASIIADIYKYEYKCSSISKQIWWQFNNHRWNKIDCGYSLSIKMSTDLCSEFVNLHYEIRKESIQLIGQEGDTLNRRCKDIDKLINNLKNGVYKERIIKECSKLLYDKNFISKLDQDNYLIGFNNGVYDLKNGIFRDGLPEDMVSKTVGYDYIKFKREDKIIKDIERFIESIQPEKDMRTYLMTYCASFLEGSNKDQIFMIWTGSGSNGKGSLIDLLDRTFNSDPDGYYGVLPPTVFTQKRGSSSGATPELADKVGKRIISLQEPEGDDKINVGFMKNITGQDKIEVRGLYCDPFQFTPQFKIFLVCNDNKPEIKDYSDEGTWRRVRVIDFGIKFTSNPQKPNERKSDPKLREDLKFYNQGFIWILINDYYRIYVDNEGLEKITPEKVKLSTNKYKNDSNIFMEFFNETLEKDKESSLLMNDVYEMFKGWYINSNADKKPLSRKNFKGYCDSNGFEVVSNSMGIIIKGIKTKEPSYVDINELDTL